VDVFHGDSRQEASRVQVQVLPTEQPENFNLKITSSALIDEPVVSVYLRAGCTQKFSRKFVLLAEFPSDVSTSPSRAVTPAAPQVPTIVPVEAPASSAAPASAAPASPAAQTTSKTVLPIKAAKVPKVTAPVAMEVLKEAPKEPAKEVAKAPAAPAPKKESAPAKPPKAEKPAEPAPKAAATGKPHLRLDPIETLNERIKTLESTTTASDLQDDISRDSKRMQSLQTDLRNLLDQAAKNEASLVAMRERLEKAEADRVPVAVVYGLLALVVLTLGALAFLWNKRPKSAQWEEDQAHPVPRPDVRGDNAAPQ
jgi:hypothetical protein